MSGGITGESEGKQDFVKQSDFDSLNKRLIEAERYIHEIHTVRNVVGALFGVLVVLGAFSSWQGWIEPFRKIDYNTITQNIKKEFKVTDTAFFENPTLWFDRTKLPEINKSIQSDMQSIKNLFSVVENKSTSLDARIQFAEAYAKNLSDNISFLSQSIISLRNNIDDTKSRNEQLIFNIERQSKNAINVLNAINRATVDSLFHERVHVIAQAVADLLHADEDFGALIHARLLPQHSLIATFVDCPSGSVRVAKINLREQRQVRTSPGPDPVSPTSHEISLCKVGVAARSGQATGNSSSAPTPTGINVR